MKTKERRTSGFSIYQAPDGAIRRGSGSFTRAELQVMSAALDMKRVLRAIRARIDGEWDNPDLMSMGALRINSDADIMEWTRDVLHKAGWGA